MGDTELNVSEIIDNMAQEIASLIKQVYIKNAQIVSLQGTIRELSKVTELFEERPEVTE